jgi:DNA-binding transcriptional ArsR family regulator
VPQLRIHFTDADLARTRLKTEVDLMWEVVSSVQVLQHAEDGLSFDPWRHRVRERVGRDGELRTAVRSLMVVAPHAPYFPDFLTPMLDTTDIDVGAEAVLATPSDRVCAELSRVEAATGPAARWLEELACGRSAALRHLREAIRRYFGSVLEPYLQVIDNGLRIECAGAAQRYLSAGPEGLLRWLSPAAHWTPPVLSIDYPVDRDLYLDGRGLVLIPCYFCMYHPVALADPQLPPVLVFPISTSSRLLASGRDSGDPVSALLGATRTTILRAVVSGSTTTKLARLAGVAPATISHHTTVLRDAGLITTDRHENFAIHTITTLGLQVLGAGSVGGSV